jgi:RNA polymerase sigma-70 factor, ECF subfamily
VLDVESFTALLTRAFSRLWLIAAAISGDRTEADDIVQESALVALRKRSEFVAGTNFMAWMSQIVRLTALNHVRKAGHRIPVPTDPLLLDHLGASGSSISGGSSKSGDETAVIGDDGHLALHQTDFDDQVLGALSSVSSVARACLLLRTVQDLSYAEIAKTLQIPEGTAMSHVHRAKQMLRDRLKGRRGGALTGSDDRQEHE